jgi:hypothetical protein
VARHNYVHRNSLTFAQLLARLQAMREAFRTVAALRSALSTRGNLEYIPREPYRRPGVRLDGDLVIRDER